MEIEQNDYSFFKLLTFQITDKVSALNTLVRKLGELSSYLADCVSGKLPANHSIIAMLQVNLENFYWSDGRTFSQFT